MFNLTTELIEPFVQRLQHTYRRMYGRLEPDYPGIIGWAGHMTLELIANSDALYHTAEHTILVTLVGQDILRGKHFHDGGVSPWDWLHVIMALLCHDIGYVRGVCRADCQGRYTTGTPGQMVSLPAGAHGCRSHRLSCGSRPVLCTGTLRHASRARCRYSGRLH